MGIENAYEYISRINWTNDSKQLAIQTFNRHQSDLNIQLTDVFSGKGKVIFNEKMKSMLKSQQQNF